MVYSEDLLNLCIEKLYREFKSHFFKMYLLLVFLSITGSCLAGLFGRSFGASIITTRLISVPLGIVFLAFALPFYNENGPILTLNLYHALFLFSINFIVSFLIDLYIIFFCNVSVFAKFTQLCLSMCFLWEWWYDIGQHC